MRSNVCRIENGVQDLEAILRESEKVAVYNELDHKQSLQLRLLCEEVDGMLPNLINDFGGNFWIDFEDGVCKVNVSIELARFTVAKKKELVAIATNKKNAAAVGICGKIRSVLENLICDADVVDTLNMSMDAFNISNAYLAGMNYAHVWSLDRYKTTVDKETEAYDELERSVIAAVADDVIVGVTAKRADIIIVKKFA